jgi:hypothetical protein
VEGEGEEAGEEVLEGQGDEEGAGREDQEDRG